VSRRKWGASRKEGNVIRMDSIEPPQPRIAPMIAPGLNGQDPVNNNGNRKPNDRSQIPEYKRPQTSI
jgi:hypothetical protein